MHGQGVAAHGHHPLADALSAEEISAYLGDVAGVIERCVAQMGSHGAFVKRYCS